MTSLNGSLVSDYKKIFYLSKKLNILVRIKSLKGHRSSFSTTVLLNLKTITLLAILILYLVAMCT